MSSINLTDSVKIEDVLNLEKTVSYTSGSNTGFATFPISITLEFSPYIIASALFFLLYNKKPKIQEFGEPIIYFDGRRELRVEERHYRVWWGWKWFPWQHIPFVNRLRVITVDNDTTPKFYYIPRKYDADTLPDSCVEKKDLKNGKVEVLLKNKTYFKEFFIEEIHLTAEDKSSQDYIANVSTKFYPNPENPLIIQISNDNKIIIRNLKITFDKKPSKNILKRKKDYPLYLRTRYGDKIADCLVEDEILMIEITELPKKNRDVPGFLSISLD